MTGSGILIDYQGNIDYPSVDSMLTGLKGNRAFMELFTTTRKRAYSIIVESVENILRHSALRSADNIDLQPRILVSFDEKRIRILASNAVKKDKMKELLQKLEYVNSLERDDLKKLHEIRINQKAGNGENGAGLGLISMAFKSGNKLNYRFNPIVTGYLSFELEMHLNK